MDISYGELAGLIAAIAFLILVIFLAIFLVRAARTMKELSKTVAETTVTVNKVTDDVQALSEQVEGLLVKSNTLLNDINGKVKTLDPVFVAAADVGDSVSKINASSQNLAHRFSGYGANATKAGLAASVMRKFRKKKN